MALPTPDPDHTVVVTGASSGIGAALARSSPRAVTGSPSSHAGGTRWTTWPTSSRTTSAWRSPSTRPTSATTPPART